MNAPVGLSALFLSSFTSATLLPGTSELALVALLAAGAATLWPAVGVATLGNSLGALTTYAIGRAMPQRVDARALHWLARYGVVALLLSWLPIVGDALCLAAGWLRLPLWQSALCLTAGKFARYWVIAQWTM